MKRTLILGLVTLASFGCGQSIKKETPQSHYKARIYQTELDQFGYDIYRDSVLLVHQPIIPAVSGNKGFRTRDDAQKVADLIIGKLYRGMSPPTVTTNELDSLNVSITN